MRRDALVEYRQAMQKRIGGGLHRLRAAELKERQGLMMAEAIAARFETCRPAPMAEVKRSRPLVASSMDDFGAAIRVLQRHNKLLVQRFGIDWALAAGVVQQEARTRGLSTAALARLLVAGARLDGEQRDER